jgi:hypothetical protein
MCFRTDDTPERRVGHPIDTILSQEDTRLVADVVTGKFDVREEAARLPEGAAPETGEDDTDLSIEPEAPEEEAAV